MAYIPPHKRHLKEDSARPLPTPALLAPKSPALLSAKFGRNLNVKSSKYNSERRKDEEVVSGEKTIYATQIFGYADVLRLKPISSKSPEQKTGEKPLILVSTDGPEGVDKSTRSCEKSPWVYVTEKIQYILQTSVQNMINEMDLQESEDVKPYCVVKFGTTLFHQKPSSRLETISQKSALETALSGVKKTFSTSFDSSYVEDILHAAPNIGFDFHREKEYYHVNVFDKNRPHETLSCICSAMNMEGKLEINKIIPMKSSSTKWWSVDLVRLLVLYIPCPENYPDLKFMLNIIRISKELPHDEMDGLKNLIASAIIDPDVKGGLRWPLGKDTFGDRYKIVGAWHIKTRVFRNSSMKFSLTKSNKFNFITSTGGVAKRVNLRMRGRKSLLWDQTVIGPLSKFLEDALKLVSEHFLDGGSSFPRVSFC